MIDKDINNNTGINTYCYPALTYLTDHCLVDNRAADV